MGRTLWRCQRNGICDSFTRIIARTELFTQRDERHNFVHIKISKEHHDSLT